MKITIENVAAGCEPEIVIRCHQLDESLLQLIYALKNGAAKKLVGEADAAMHLIEPKEVFYFEAVDDKVFIYCRDKVYETRKKLYQIEEEYGDSGFLRASKSIILNLSKVKALSPAFNGRIEALLHNGEKVIISRQYVPELKHKLGI